MDLQPSDADDQQSVALTRFLLTPFDHPAVGALFDETTRQGKPSDGDREYDSWACGAPVVVPAQTGPADRRIYVVCHQCDNCQHIGINDEHETESACNRGACGWHGPSPTEDLCPGCGERGTMASSCPECGGHYMFLADADVVPS